MISGLLFFSSCIGEHNKPPKRQKNVKSKNFRVFGNVGGAPIQLKNEYDEPEGHVKRMAAIQDKLYPR